MNTGAGGFDRIVCLSPLPWAGQWTSRHEICAELARRGADVVFVDPPDNQLRPAGLAASRSVPAGIRVLTPPPRLPYGVLRRWPAVARRVIDRNAREYASFVANAVDDPAATTLLVNSFFPVLGHRVAALLDPEAHLYHRADDLASFPSTGAVDLALERRVLAQADAVACVTEAVRQPIAGQRPDAVVVRNGVDVSRFAQADPDPRLSALEGPVAVVVGQVDHRTDPAVLDAIARAMTLVVVGPVAPGHHLPAACIGLGPVEPDRIPGILAAAAVAVVPYVGFAGDPLKVYEYLAAGLPVVGVDGPWTEHHPAARALATVGHPRELPGAVVAAAASRTPAGDVERRGIAAEHGWSRRVDDLLSLVGSIERSGAAR